MSIELGEEDRANGINKHIQQNKCKTFPKSWQRAGRPDAEGF